MTFFVLFRSGIGGMLGPMLKTLRFHHLGLFERTEIDLGPGLTAMTGESGAGKSLVLGGLSLLAGSIRTRLRPRPSRDSGFVEAEFDIGGNAHADLRSRLSDLGLLDADSLVLARRIQTTGRTRAFVQGQQVSRTLLEELGTYLFEFCDQGQSHGLRAPMAQLEALDQFLGLLDERKTQARLFERLRRLEAECSELQGRRAENERRLDFVDYQIEEIDGCSFEDFENKEASLEQQKQIDALDKILRDSWGELAGDAHSALHRLRFAQKSVDAAEWPEESGDQTEICDRMGQLVAMLQDLEELLRTTIGGLPFLPKEERQALEQEVERTRVVAQKHRVRPEDLARKRVELAAAQTDLRAEGHKLQVLLAEQDKARNEAERGARFLHERRLAGVKRFDATVTQELERLGLECARVETHLACGDLGPTGKTQITIGFSTSSGQAALPLGRIASGGELARVLLSMRLALGPRAPLLCFDEIDAGAGGTIASRIGEALRRASAGGQVLCVSHWPQVACLAQNHLRVSKHSDGGTSRLEVLGEEERLRELTRMLGGNAKTAHEHAQLLRQSAA